MLGFIVGCVTGGIVSTAMICCCVMAGMPIGTDKTAYKKEHFRCIASEVFLLCV